MMKSSKAATLVLAGFLHFAPFAARTVATMPALAASPVAIVLKWVVGALAVAGTYHAVSAASATLQSKSTIAGTVGTRVSYQIKISDGETRQPESWIVDGQVFSAKGSTKASLPPGLSMSLSTGIISGTPTQGGSFNVPISAFEHANLSGAELDFTLTFNIAGGVPAPVITVQPSGGDVQEGGVFTFSVTATGSGTLAYQWQVDSTDIPDATGPTLNLNPVRLFDAGVYTVVVSNAGGSTPSNPVTLNVTPAPAGPVITSQPLDTTLHSGEALTLRVTAEGSGSLAYQWQRDGQDLAGQNAATLSISSLTVSDAGQYVAVVSDGGSSVTSAPATVTVVALSMQVTGLTGQGASIVLNTIPGRTYVVEASDAAVGSPWQTIGTETATGDTTPFSDAQVTRSQRFWRYHVAP